MTVSEAENTIAIIGMSGRFPGASHVGQFWDNLTHGRETITFFTDDMLRAAGIKEEKLQDPNYVKASPVLADIDKFDYPFFGMSKREAELLDPQHRLLLMCAWEAIEDAGYAANSYEGLISLFAGCGFNNYLVNEILPRRNDFSEEELQMVLQTNGNDYLSTRISYKLNLRGTSVTIQTACSTSLVAVHYACQSLLMYQSDLALAGGASLRIPQWEGYMHQAGGIFSPDGHCRAFDAEAKGTIFGSGAGIVALKRLEDALADRDHIYALIKGSAANNDGASKVGYTAPSIEGQRRVVAEALMMAEADPRTLGYIEAHGTGTALGDPIEIAALQEAFGDIGGAKQYCAIGSVKTNIGHLNAASGIAGLIKTALMLHNKQLPPSLHYKAPNPAIDFMESPFYVNTALTDWPAASHPRRAGVSSFGIGGTNAHLILEEAPMMTEKPGCRTEQTLLLSARTDTALDAMAAALDRHLQLHPDVAMEDVAYTLQVGRKAFPYRYAALSGLDGGLKLIGRTKADKDKAKIIFMFPGQGSQYTNMAAGLYEHFPLFRSWADKCFAVLNEHLRTDLAQALFREAEAEGSRLLDQTAIAQPLLFVVEYALARCLMDWGLEPHAMIGHSLGEYVAACVAGVMPLEDALAIIAQRGALMQQSPAGAMLAVSAPFGQIRSCADEGVHLSAINGPGSCTVAGDGEAISRLAARLEAEGIGHKLLPVAHAFHSPLMAPAAEQFERVMRKYKLHAPRIPYLSNVSGDYITEAQAKDTAYWSGHIRAAVKFSAGIETLMQSGEHLIWLEVGPGKALSQLVHQHDSESVKGNVLNMMRHGKEAESDVAALLKGLSACWLSGADIRWEKLHPAQPGRVSLPTYPFEGVRCWLGGAPHRVEELAVVTAAGNPDIVRSSAERAHLSTAYVPPADGLQENLVDIWEQVLGIRPIGIKDDFFELGGHSLMATQLISRLRNLIPDIEIQFDRIFNYPTIEEIAEQIELQMIEQLESNFQ
ncbi:type I polyketide synthase [Paenibacillus apiarius]|uniref:Type I polyketide synthase n=1 Tax=Paenibacillus apiarius TaxID=46240 RepID=A0ABT4E0J3_9BACL|nr:type I polyketide synthase [Paenibacillus apiarius]MCY9517875.1 type I polyketide synthase [Paenibacillus apiarius]MCY9523124.1 type I polyketide synthase [Paenibacillus apiarius]MCY9553922.1 type I polyketide synthase [Paenibacillus apiarius]MCY9559938.1 type I polyketide synthase [Paenibacillus apiarius]MCY9686409.1 type I polyketide synthase [Paenibacillus apiarius]